MNKEENTIKYVIDLSPDAPWFKNTKTDNKKDNNNIDRKEKKIKVKKVSHPNKSEKSFKIMDSGNVFINLSKAIIELKAKKMKAKVKAQGTSENKKKEEASYYIDLSVKKLRQINGGIKIN